MSVNDQERYAQVIDKAIEDIKAEQTDLSVRNAFNSLRYAIGFSFGPCPVQRPDNSMEVVMTGHWDVNVSVKSLLLGHPRHSRTVPIPQGSPDDEVVMQAVLGLVQSLMQAREEEAKIPEGSG